jgi:flavorubredoxin
MVDQDDETPGWYEPKQAIHIPQNAYLFTDDYTLLFDTLSPASTGRILREVKELLDGDNLDYLVVSHPDVPHAGNTAALLNEYPEATLVAPEYGSGHELYHLDQAKHVSASDTINLGTHTVEFHEATFLDAALHLWMTEQKTNTLFTVDWFGYPHTDAECLTFGDEFKHELTSEQLAEFHGRVLFWLQYVDVEKTKAEVDHLIEKFHPSIVAPAHGNVIHEHTTEHMRKMKPVIEQIDQEGRVGTLG